MMMRDPEMEADRLLRQYLRARLKRWPTDADVVDYLGEERSKFEQNQRQREEEETKDRAKKQQEEEERQKLRKEHEAQRSLKIAERLRNRDTAPHDYVVADSVEKLERQAADNQAFAEGARLIGTRDQRIKISIDLSLFRFSGAKFEYVTFLKSANLAGVDFTASIFSEVIFEDELSLEGVEFREAQFSDVIFKNECVLTKTSFENARFGRNVSIEFDESNILGARFAVARKDAWYRLAISYLGIFQFINVALSGVYFSLLLAKLSFFKLLSIIEGEALGALSVSPRANSRSISVYEFVFGAEKAAVFTAIVVLIYQAMRVFLTLRISPLIDAERVTGWTPSRSSYLSYTRYHDVVRVLGFVAIASFAWEVWKLFQQPPIFIFKTIGS